MRCPACDARNPDTAAWCGQCYGSLTSPDPGGDPGSVLGTAGEAEAPGRPVRERDGEVEWRCDACGSWAALARDRCPVCGTARTGFGEGRATEGDQPARATVVAASLVLPGAGHLLLGAHGTGVARILLAALWGIGGATMLLGAGDAGAGTVLIVGAVVLWAATALDAGRAADGGAESLLGGRRLGVLVLVVTGLLIALAVATTLRATG